MNADLKKYAAWGVDFTDQGMTGEVIRDLVREVVSLCDEVESLKGEIASLKEELEESRRYARSLVYGGDSD